MFLHSHMHASAKSSAPWNLVKYLLDLEPLHGKPPLLLLPSSFAKKTDFPVQPCSDSRYLLSKTVLTPWQDELTEDGRCSKRTL